MGNYNPNIENDDEIRVKEPMTFEKASAQMPMKFHKHLVLWILWVSVAANLSQGILYLTGAYTSGIAELATMDRIQGAIGIVMAGIAFFARIQLKDFKSGAPALLYAMQGISIAWSAIYYWRSQAVLSSVNAFITYGPNAGSSGSIIAVIGLPLAIMIAYIRYFSKRSHLYYN